MKTRIATLAAVAMLASACSEGSQAEAQSPEEAVMFFAFGLRDKATTKDKDIEFRVEKTSEAPLAFQLKVIPEPGQDPIAVSETSVAKVDACQYVVSTKSLHPSMANLRDAKFQFDFKSMTGARLEGGETAKFEGVSIKCLEPADRCEAYDRDIQSGGWNARIGPLDPQKTANLAKHQAELNAAVTSFQANVCKP